MNFNVKMKTFKLNSTLFRPSASLQHRLHTLNNENWKKIFKPKITTNFNKTLITEDKDSTKNPQYPL